VRDVEHEMLYRTLVMYTTLWYALQSKYADTHHSFLESLPPAPLAWLLSQTRAASQDRLYTPLLVNAAL
jgi:hypothetical protein